MAWAIIIIAASITIVLISTGGFVEFSGQVWNILFAFAAFLSALLG
tara:strand:- start:20 stop:157 length:138 start_codon:yes stop_codon:yes gene_type:complete